MLYKVLIQQNNYICWFLLVKYKTLLFLNQTYIYNNQRKSNKLRDDDVEEEDEYDEENDIREDNDYDDYDQQQKMKQMRKNQLQEEGRGAKSAHPRMRGSKNQIDINKPQLHDLTRDQVGYGIRPSTAIQIKQLEMIQEYNKALPKRKQNQSLPLIQAHNIGTKSVIKKDHKKQTVEEIIKYTPIGLVDDQLDSNENQGSKFGMGGKIRHLKIQSAKQRIETLRKYKGELINARTPFTDEQNLDNVFVSSSKGSDAYSLSVYNRAEKFARPLTAPTQNNWFKGMQKLQPVPEEEETQVPDTRFPDFKVPKELQPISRGAIDGFRLEQVNEIESIKERLARDNCPQSVGILQRAILMPEDVEYQPGLRKYPTPGDALMINPFPKKKKKKGKKKGKKKSKK